MTQSLDLATMRAAFAGPGADTRQWSSFGTVDPGEKSVIFTDENGDPSPIGPIVVVTLHPSGITVPCRVAGSVAGQDEGEWFPFLPGDEVEVIVNEGDERAGCVIVGRLNQSIDRFPLTVAGQDVTKNTFGFKRLRTPYIIETASSFMIRSAVTGAGLTIDQEGNAFFISGDGHKIVLHGSFLKFGNADDSTFLQIDTDGDSVMLQGGGTTQFVLDKDASTFFTMGTLDVGTGGAAGSGHAITVEQVICLLVNFLHFMKLNLPTLSGDFNTLFNPATFPAPLDAALAQWIQLAGTPSPLTAATGGGNMAQLPLTFGPFGAIKASLVSNPLPDVTGLIPGIGRANFTL